MLAGGSSVVNAANYVKQAGGSCGTHEVQYVINEQVPAVCDSKESQIAGKSVDCGKTCRQGMVRRVRKAKPRSFPARRMKRARGVYNWRKTSPDVMRHLLALLQCVNVIADVPLAGRSSVQLRSELRSRLARSLAQGEKEKAFAKACGFSDKPKANDPEAMMNAFPGLDRIDWDALPVPSGINADLWKSYHARHCKKCSEHAVHRDCY